MGRTLNIHFKKEKGAKFSDKEIEQIIQVGEKYNSGKLANVWSCENFYPQPIQHIVDWDGKRGYEIKLILRHELNNGNGFDWANYINAKIEDLIKGKEIIIGEKCQAASVRTTYNTEKKVYTRIEATRMLVKEGWIMFWGDNKIGEEFSDFVKVQGNEFNAMLVFLACKEISMLIPKAEITLQDEGEFLLCPIKISCGRAIPLLSLMQEKMEHMALKMLFSKGFKGNILKKITPNAKEFAHEFRMDFHLDNSYGDMTRYINECLRNIKEVEKRLSPLVEKSNEMYVQNLENRSKEDGWFEPEIFTRINEINPYDFVTYKMAPSTLMDGFDGEYYGLSTEDAESKSYKHIAQLQKVLGKLNINNAKLSILGEDEKK